MKHTLFLCLLLISSGLIYAQTTVDSALRFNLSSMNYSDAVDVKVSLLQAVTPTDTTEGGDINEFSRKAAYREKYISTNVPNGADMFLPAAKTLSYLMTHPNAYCSGSGGNWQCMGPFTSSYGGGENQGRASSIWVNPANDSFMLAATFGGLWKSTTAGLHWRNISDNIGSGMGNIMIPGDMGMISLAVDPINNNRINVFLANWGGMALGAAFTTDGGNTWQLDTAFNNLTGFTVFSNEPSIKMMYLPGTEKLFAYVNNGIYLNSTILMKPNVSTPWQNITPLLGVDSIVTDMEFTIASPGKVVFSTNAADYTAHLWTYDTTTGWSNLDVTMPAVGDTITGINHISLSATDSVFMLVGIKNGYQQLVKTALSTLSINVLNTYAYWGTALENLIVSPNNTRVMYATNHNAANNFYQSTNWGASFSPIQGETHADGRSISMYSPATSGGGLYDDVLYGTTDGGIVMKRSGNINFESITGDGLCITEFFGMSNMEGEDDLVMGGAQDNGAFTYRKNRSSQWNSHFLSDSHIPIFATNGIKKGIYEYVENGTPTVPEFHLGGIDFSSSSDLSFGVSDPGDTCNEAFWSSLNNNIRPWYVDKNNNLYIGERTVWKSTNFGISWSDLFHGHDPIDRTNCPKVCGVSIAEPNSDTAYVAYRDPSWGLTSANPKLFVSFNALSTDLISPPTWTDITPAEVEYQAIGAIDIDPKNPGRIWVGLAGIDNADISTSVDSSQHKIYYSPNYGANWYDVSRGLSPLPVLDVKYRHGSNDELYAATGVGVYHCDFSTFNSSHPPFYDISWQCFNNGMPVCNVTNLQFNYCAGKLRVSTFGRGIWESDIPTFAPNPTDTITTNTIWTTNQYITTGIDIRPGVKLTLVGDTVHMPKNGLISVEPGGQLIVNHAVLTNDCDQCFWQGIQVKGSNVLAQSAANQGWVIIDSGTVIEHAKIGVTNFGNSGGIIQAANSSFIDNNNAVTVSDYVYYGSSGVAQNVSNFYNCTFLLDNNYKGDKLGYPMNNFVNLTNVNGVILEGCNFLNRDTAALDRGKGEGIHAVYAGFSVSPLCAPGLHSCPYPVRSRFSGFINAISTQGDFGGADFTVSIDQADFDSSGVGVNVSAENNVSVTRCGFNVGNGIGIIDVSAGCYQNIGIYTHNTPQFRIEDNDFEGKPSGAASTSSTWHNVGVAVANANVSSVTANKVYLSTFDSLTEGVMAVGDNAAFTVACNTFTNNNTDILVANDPGTVPWQGISPNQGSEYLPTKPAGNTFSGSVNNIVNNTANSISYFYYIVDSTTERPHVISGHVTATPVNTPKSCGSTISIASGAFGPVRLDQSTLQTYKEEFRIAKRSWEDSLLVYYELLDNGSTPSMVHGIQTSVRPLQLDSLVRPPSPWLSDSSLYHVTRRGLLPYARYISVLRRNPVVLSEPGFLPYAHTAYSITPTDMVMLSDSAKAIDRRVKLEHSIAKNKIKMDEAANIIMMALKAPNDTAVSVLDSASTGVCMDNTSIYYMLDSNSRYTQFDSVGKWYKEIGSLWSWYARVGYYNFIGERVHASRLFERIGELLSIDSLGELRPDFAFQSTPQDINVYRTYTRLWDVMRHAESRGSDIFHLDSLEIARLDTSSGPAFTYNTARQIITSITTGIINVRVLVLPCHYTRFTLRDAGGGTGGESDNIGELSSGVSYPSDNGNVFSAYPNPASGMVTFEYNIPDAGNDVRIVITDVVGQQVAELHTGNNAGKILWDTHLLANGIYLFQASTDNGLVSVGKIVLAK